jgi:hypothetical protein
MGRDRHWFEYFSSVRRNVVLVDMARIGYTGGSSAHFSCCLPILIICVVLLYSNSICPCLHMAFYSWHINAYLERHEEATTKANSN